MLIASAVRSVWCCGRSGVWVYVEQKTSSKRSCHFPKTRLSRLSLWQLSVPTNATSHNPFPLALCAKAVQCGEAIESATKRQDSNPKPVLTTITVKLRDAAPIHCMTYGYVYIADPSERTLAYHTAFEFRRCAFNASANTREATPVAGI